MRSTFLLSLFIVSVGGCGDHGVPSPNDMAVSDDLAAPGMDMAGIPDDAKRIVTFSMFAQDYAEAICAHAMTCGQLDAAQLPACIERNLLHTGWDQDVEIMKGRMEINELQCLAAIQASRCDLSDSGAWTSRCQAFLYTGHQPSGAACIAAAECTTGYCQHAGSDGGMAGQATGCPGTCAAPKPPGSPCRISSDCTADSYCDFRTTHQCVKLAALNESCTNLFGVGSGPGCQYGLSCPTFPGAGVMPSCQIPATKTTVGDDCDPYQGGATPTPSCATGMYCQQQYSASTTACTGQPNDCSTLLGAYCNTTTGFCQVPSGGKCETKLLAGADCDPRNEGFFSFVESQCADGSICEQLPTQTKPTCQALGAANASCVGNTSCKIGFYCDPTAHTCTSWLSDGQTCTGATSAYCPSSASYPLTVCIADNADAGTTKTCETVKNFGASCIPGFEDDLCQPSDLPPINGNPSSSVCTPNGTGGGTCTPRCY